MDRDSREMTLIRVQDEILSAIRHNLGNSVNALKVTLEVLNENFDHFDDEKRKLYVSRGLGLLSRQQDLVEAMKSYALPLANLRQEIDLIPFWERFRSSIAVEPEQVHVQQSDLMDLVPGKVAGDAMALEQALGRLLDNALEAVAGIPDTIVEVVISATKDEVLISVRDYGPEVEKETLDRAFIPLFTTKPGKNGMGLPIAKRLITEMGGRLEIAPAKGGGHQATICLKRIDGTVMDV